MTVVIRDDFAAGSKVAANARWLFPPEVHQLLAEQHGIYDLDNIPNAALAAQIGKLSEGSASPASLEQLEESKDAAGNPHLILKTDIETPPPLIPITWIADPAAAAVNVSRIAQELPQIVFGAKYNEEGGHEPPPAWAPPPAGATFAGKLLKIWAAREVPTPHAGQHYFVTRPRRARPRSSTSY